MNTDLIKKWFPRTTLYENIPNEFKQSLGEPLSEKELRFRYENNQLPEIYKMGYNPQKKQTDDLNNGKTV